MAKNFSWSFSKAKNYDTCPKRHYEVDLAKNYADDTEQLKWGNEVHAALANAVMGTAKLPDSMKDFGKWVHAYKRAGQIAVKQGGLLLTEQKFAITKDFQPCGWSEWSRAWCRMIADVLIVNNTVALTSDWKTGAIKHDSRQLMLVAQGIFAHHPAVQTVHTEFVWLKDDCHTSETFERNTIVREWPPVLALVSQMEQAAKTMTYPPKPGKLCARWCPVLSCPFHGKRQ